MRQTRWEIALLKVGSGNNTRQTEDRRSYCECIMHGIFSTNYKKIADQKIELLLSIPLDNSGVISFFLALTFSLNSLLVGLALSRIPQHSQNNLSVKK